MKKKFFILFILFFTQIINGQLFKNYEPITAIFYKADVYGGLKLDKKASIDDIGYNFLMQKVFDIGEYGLYMTKNESLFTFVPPPETTNRHIKLLIKMEACGIHYKNIINKETIIIEDLKGQYYNIIYPFEPYKWTITNETKKILGYTCYKATTLVERLDYYDNKIMVPGPVVWFTPEIPIPFGPIGIDGLPGVVLEASEKGKMYFYATKIISDYKDPLITIEIPKGKFITPEEYDRKITEKY